ncbi:MAG: ATP-binding protein [Lachnospiraceae bacterium]
MGLKNYQYNSIMRQYDDRQAAARALLDKRRAEVDSAVPAYRELEERIIEGSIRCAKQALYGGQDTIAALRAENRRLSEQKQELLVAAGFPADYLTPSYLCPDCQDTGMIGEERCHCFKQAVVDLLYKQSNLGDILKEENFSTFSFDYYNNTEADAVTGMTPLQNMHRIYDTAVAFVKKFDSEYQNLLFYGNSGLGKTFLSHCIANELIGTAHTVLYLTAYQLFDILGKSFKEDTEASNAASAEHILDCDLLIIDDLGTELSTAFTISRFSQCINERYLNKRSTIISTNFSIQDLSNMYGERNFSRISSSYTLLRFSGEDIRLKKRWKTP